jgi:hypothetical protein
MVNNNNNNNNNMYYKGTIGRFNINNPKNGQQRVIADRDNFKHLEVFCTVAGDMMTARVGNLQIRTVQ